MEVGRCPACPGVNTCVQPDGPLGSPCLFLGEAPGGEENKSGVPFTTKGKTGKETNEHYLPLAGLRRPYVRFDNAIHCLPTTSNGKLDLKKPADRELLRSCASHHLYPHLECNHYRVIVTMGAFAAHAIDPDISLELQHGFPVQTKYGVVFPMYHPAGGIHEPKKMLQIRTDWIRLKQYLNNKLYIPEDQYDGREEYGVVESPGHLESILQGAWDQPLANDTETTRDHDPFCLTLSIQPGSGWLIPADREDILDEYQTHLNQWTGPILFHNWLFDGAVVKRMGLRFPKKRKRIVDTMVRAFHLGNLPQGLKALSYRELGMRMQDFDDLVRPHSVPLVLRYYREAYMEDWVKPDKELVRDKEGKLKLYSPQSMKTKLKRFFTDYTKNPEKDVFDMWTKNWEDSQQMIEEKCGRWPGKCITHVPFEEVIHYACRDADATLRLWPILQWMKSQVRHVSQDGWRDHK